MADLPERIDCFISYSSKNRERAEEADHLAKSTGLVSYLAHRENTAGDPWPRKLAEALARSQRLLLIWSQSAAKSKWVDKEITSFEARSDASKIVVVREDDTELPVTTVGTHQPADLQEAILTLANQRIEALSSNVIELKEELSETHSIISDQLKEFIYKKIWKGFFDKQVHIFICGRDVPNRGDLLDQGESGRGSGGRTNIDRWDYQTVCDIHSFFARHNPQTHLEIVQPTSKVAAPKMDLSASLSNELQNKDCIIIGSPDVSDYAELVLAKLHNIEPWVDARQKQSGFVIMKARGPVGTPSAVYWGLQEGEEEGVALVNQDRVVRTYHAKEDDAGGVTYGILTLARNPCELKPKSNIMILSGFSGIATNAIASFLTAKAYKHELYDLDQKMKRRRPVEVLIRVEYTKGDCWKDRDDRKIQSISFENLDYIKPVVA